MDITTLTRVKLLAGAARDGSDDTVLAQIIVGVSAMAEREMKMGVHRCKRKETMNVIRHQKVFNLKNTPVSTIVSVKNDQWDIPVSAVQWESNGIIRIAGDAIYTSMGRTTTPFAGTILRGELYYGPGMLIVEYIGGMATDTAEFCEKYEDIAYEADKQVVFEFRRMKTITEKSVSAGGATTSFETFDVRPSFLKALHSRRRRVWLA